LIAKRSGREARITCLNQLRHLGFCAPDELRERFRGVPRDRLGGARPPIVARTGSGLEGEGGSLTRRYGRAHALRGSVVLGHPAIADPDAWCLVGSHSSRPDQPDIRVIVTASRTGSLGTITRISGCYTSPKGGVIFDHPYNTESGAPARSPP
jgi:hypothetical protein